jgi:hypothetical protein
MSPVGCKINLTLNSRTRLGARRWDGSAGLTFTQLFVGIAVACVAGYEKGHHHL